MVVEHKEISQRYKMDCLFVISSKSTKLCQTSIRPPPLSVSSVQGHIWSISYQTLHFNIGCNIATLMIIHSTTERW